MEILQGVVVLALLANILAVPLQQRIETDPELTAGYFEGDIVLDDKRNGFRNEVFRWPNNTVYYRIAKGYFDDEHINYIMRAMRTIEAVSCIRFKEATGYRRNYVNITGNRGGCYSNVGFIKGAQAYNLEVYPLDTGCFVIGVIVHELLHTLGFFHMQSSSNRDNYVRIVEENILKGTIHNFEKFDADYVDDFDEEYDYGSILHYHPWSFSKNGEMTIVPLKKDAVTIMGQRREMSKGDINRLNIMYRCPLDA